MANSPQELRGQSKTIPGQIQAKEDAMSTDSIQDNAAEVKRAREQLGALEELLNTLERLGAEIPAVLSRAVKSLRIAVDTGTDVADAATETSAALAQYSNKVDEDCADDAENASVCVARHAHQWLAINEDYVLNWKNKESVVRKSVRATLQRYVPQRICHYLDLCKSTN
jgi:translation initiation factor IF-2